MFWSKLIYRDLHLFILAKFVNYKSNEKVIVEFKQTEQVTWKK